MKGAHATKQVGLRAVGLRSVGGWGGTLPPRTQPSSEELDAFYLDPTSLSRDRLMLVEAFVRRHGGGEDTRAEYLRQRRRLERARSGVGSQMIEAD